LWTIIIFSEQWVCLSWFKSTTKNSTSHFHKRTSFVTWYFKNGLQCVPICGHSGADLLTYIYITAQIGQQWCGFAASFFKNILQHGNSRNMPIYPYDMDSNFNSIASVGTFTYISKIINEFFWRIFLTSVH
jgi:hypothetical protein